MRSLYVAPQVIEELEAPGELRAASAAQVQSFIEGGKLTFSFQRRPDAMMRRLGPRKRGARPDVWELRIKSPRPGARIYGLFAARNLFIGTEFAERDQTSGDMTAEIRRAHAEWMALFPNQLPVVSERIDEYLDANVHQAL